MNDQNYPGNPEQSPERNPGERPGESTKGLTPSEAPNVSFETGAGEKELGFDSPPVTSMPLSNPEYYEGKDSEARGDVPPEEYEDIGPV